MERNFLLNILKVVVGLTLKAVWMIRHAIIILMLYFQVIVSMLKKIMTAMVTVLLVQIVLVNVVDQRGKVIVVV
jgi:hypothetical protein